MIFNKSFYIWIVVFLTFSISVMAGLSDGLTAYYSFDNNNLNDDLNLYNATNGGVGFAAGKLGNGVSASGGYFLVPSAAFPLSFDSMSVWIKRTSTSTTDCIVSNWDRSFRLCFSTATDADCAMSYGAGSYYGGAFTFNADTTAWTHVVMVDDPSDATLKVYINGVLNFSTSGGLFRRGPSCDSGKYFFMGSKADGSGCTIDDASYFGGLLDELSFYNMTLSSTEVIELYNNGNGVNPIKGVAPVVNETFFIATPFNTTSFVPTCYIGNNCSLTFHVLTVNNYSMIFANFTLFNPLGNLVNNLSSFNLSNLNLTFWNVTDNNSWWNTSKFYVNSTGTFNFSLIMDDNNSAGTSLGNFTSSFVVTNSKPSFSSVSISPIPASPLSNLTCDYVVYDNETNFSTSVSNFSWFVNNVQKSYNTSILRSGNFTNGDNVTCMVRATDGWELNDFMNSSTVNIGDLTPPSISGLGVSPLSGTTSTGFVISQDCVDSGSLISYANVSVIDPNGVSSNFLMSFSSGNTYVKSYVGSLLGTYNVTRFGCADQSGNYNSTNSSLSFIISATIIGGGGGGAPVTIIQNATLPNCNFNDVCEPDNGESLNTCYDDCKLDLSANFGDFGWILGIIVIAILYLEFFSKKKTR